MKSPEVPPWTPLARALADVHAGDRSARLRIRSDLWEDEVVSATEYYRPFDMLLPDLERRALARCRGRVLDAGAGAGRHALELQRAGFEVVAVDIAPGAVAVMRDRGVEDARVGDVLHLTGERFDTVLMLMHGLGVVGTLANLAVFMRRLHDLLAPGGQLLADSADLAVAVRKPAIEERAGGGYLGEVHFQVTYGSLTGRPYPWLFVDPLTLARVAAAGGFACEIFARGDRGSYLARLERSDRSDGARTSRAVPRPGSIR